MQVPTYLTVGEKNGSHGFIPILSGVDLKVDLSKLTHPNDRAVYFTMELLFGSWDTETTFTLLCELKFSFTTVFVGNMRRFRRICEHTQSVVSVVRRPLPPNSPRAQRRVTSGPTVQQGQPPASNNNTVERMMAGKSHQGNTEISESSSNNSDISERLQSNKMAVVAAAAAAHSQAAAAASSASPSAGNHATSAAQAAVALRQVGHPPPLHSIDNFPPPSFLFL